MTGKKIQETIVVNFDGNISNLETSLSKIRKSLTDMGLPTKDYNKANKQLQEIEKRFNTIKTKAKEGFSSTQDTSAMTKSLNILVKDVEEFTEKINNTKLTQKNLKEMSSEYKEVTEQVEKLNGKLQDNIKLSKLKQTAGQYKIVNKKNYGKNTEDLVAASNKSINAIKNTIAGGATKDQINLIIQKELSKVFSGKENTNGFNEIKKSFIVVIMPIL